MQVISEDEAHTAWVDNGFMEIFTFEEYVGLLERTHIYVIREMKNNAKHE